MACFNTPLGILEAAPCEADGTVFLCGSRNGIPFSIQTADPADPAAVDFAFVARQIDAFADIQAQTERRLCQVLAAEPERWAWPAAKPLPDGALLSCPELVFYGADAWCAVFRESPLPCAKPYGILANYRGNVLTGFEDLSEAEEI